MKLERKSSSVIQVSLSFLPAVPAKELPATWQVTAQYLDLYEDLEGREVRLDRRLLAELGRTPAEVQAAAKCILDWLGEQK